MKLKFALLAGIAGLTTACGGGPGSFDGSVNGNTLTVKDAVVALERAEDGTVSGATIVLADVPDLCAMAKANRMPKNGTLVGFNIKNISATGEVTLPQAGEFVVNESEAQARGNVVSGSFVKLDDSCKSPDSFEEFFKTVVVSGKLTLDEVELKEGGSASGSFDLVFGSQADKVTGSFNATYCDVPETTAQPTCE